MTEDKVALVRRRTEFVERLGTPLSIEDRTRIQGELSVINAKIKALNSTLAAQLKAAADQRKAAGLAEAQSNAARARARVDGVLPRGASSDTEEDPGQAPMIDAWIDAVLLRHDVDFSRVRGTIKLNVAPSPENKVLTVLIDGVYALALGQALPELPNPPLSDEPKPKRAQSKRAKHKKR
jgi:hypothetical protein